MRRPHRPILPGVGPSALVYASAHVIGDVETGLESSAWMTVAIRGEATIGNDHRLETGAAPTGVGGPSALVVSERTS
jgi:carbonic anhydrase/acetyltransferase-like protein (isoleucine patch superfamily)